MLNPKRMGNTDDLVNQDSLEEYYRIKEEVQVCPVTDRACAQFRVCVTGMLDEGMEPADAIEYAKDDCQKGLDIPFDQFPYLKECGIERAHVPPGS